MQVHVEKSVCFFPTTDVVMFLQPLNFLGNTKKGIHVGNARVLVWPFTVLQQNLNKTDVSWKSAKGNSGLKCEQLYQSPFSWKLLCNHSR